MFDQRVVSNACCAQFILLFDMEEHASEAARRLASLRRRYKKTCPVCGKEFEGIATRIYDRPACQVKASRLRRKGDDQRPDE
jgi:hypothetical protein